MLVAVVVGGMLGASWGRGFFDIVTGAVLGALVLRSLRQGSAIKALEAQRDAVRKEAMPPAPIETAAPRPAAVATVAVAPPVPDFAPTLPPDDEPSPAPAPAPLPREPAPPRPNPLAPLQQWLFGGNTIVKAGVGILFIGLAFLAKFASEHVHVPIEVRLAGIGLAAIVLLVVGWRLRDKRPGYAQVLQGGAVAVLYLTLFVAFRFFGVLAVTPVFVLMVAVAALSAALAVLQDARALAVIGALGGFAAPLLISTGSGNHVALFSYYLVLDLGIALVAWRRFWPSLNLIGFAGTFIVATAWGVLKYQPANYATSQAFLAAFFLLFTVIGLLPLRSAAATNARALPTDRLVQGALLFGLPTITFVLQHGLVRDTEYGSAVSALVLALFYLVLASWMRTQPRLAAAFEGSIAVGTVFTTLVIPFALDARSTAGAWALEGAGLVWLGLRQARWPARAFGYALLVLSALAMLWGFDRHGTPTSVFNAYLFNALMAAAAALATARFADRRRDALAAWEAPVAPLAIGLATLWLLAASALQIDRFVEPPFQLAAWLACLAAIALAYMLLAQRLAWPRVGLPVIGHAPLLAFASLGLAVALGRPLDHGGWWAWPLAFAVHALVLARLAPAWPALARELVHTMGVLALALLGALAGRALTHDWGDDASAWSWLGWLAVPALLLVLIARPATGERWPVRAAPAAYQWTAGLFIAAGLVGWTLLANLGSNGAALPLPYVPLANPLDLGIAIALVAVAAWLKSAPVQARWAAQPGVPIALVGGAAFVWLNAMLVRAFHHYGGVPFRFDAWMRSLAVQTGLTLLWSVLALALMWLSAKRAWRWPWMVGAALLGAVVLKLLLIDLSGTGTVTRIVSFIGVGVLMLVIGYVAPLPGKAAEETPNA